MGNLTNDTPPKKRGFGPPLVRYVFHPPQVSVLCFSCTRIHDRADQKLFWRGPKELRGERVLWYVPPPHTLCTPPYHGPIAHLHRWHAGHTSDIAHEGGSVPNIGGRVLAKRSASPGPVGRGSPHQVRRVSGGLNSEIR